MKSRTSIIIYAAIAFLLIIAFFYWYLFLHAKNQNVSIEANNTIENTGFQPLNTNSQPENNQPEPSTENNATSTPQAEKLPVLRKLSNSPVGGYGITTTFSKNGQPATTTTRWVDRGRGNIYQATGDNSYIATLSNTLVPKIYQSWWNKDLSVFYAQFAPVGNDNVTTVISNLVKNAPEIISTSTASSTTSVSNKTAYQLKGTRISGNVIAVAVSPQKDKVLLVTEDGNRSTGYITRFDGGGQTQVFNLPLTQIVVEWPETNTITITTKASANYAGFFYFVNAKTGAMKKILGNLAGLSAKANRSATKVIYSWVGNADLPINTAVLDIKTGKTDNVTFKTLADKCVWSEKFADEVYCSVPNNLNSSLLYPDDWFVGNTSFVDNIWLLNTNTGNVSQIADLLNLSQNSIDAVNLEIDENDSYLLFGNKKDLSLWMLDLTAGF